MTSQVVVPLVVSPSKRGRYGPYRARISQLKPSQAKKQGDALPKPQGEPKYADFGNRLTYWMAKRGMKAGELKKRMGVKDPGTISRWKKGRARPEGEDLLRLADLLEIGVNQLNPGFAPPEESSPPAARQVREAVLKPTDGPRAREVVDRVDLSKKLPLEVVMYGTLEAADIEAHGEVMPVARFHWWLERAFEAGQRSVQADSTKRRRSAG